MRLVMRQAGGLFLLAVLVGALSGCDSESFRKGWQDAREKINRPFNRD